MKIDLENARNRLKDFDFVKLFIEELGWDCYGTVLDVTVEGRTYTLAPVAQKRGMVAYVATAAADNQIPDYPTRRKIDHQVTKSAREHLLIFTDAAKTTQVWQWVKREPGKPTACRPHTFHRDQPGDALIQKLQAVAFGLEEEATVTLVDVTSRVRAGFDIEKVTKRFYEYFKTEHAAFLKFLNGIPDGDMQRWYVSVMLNRLMFIYFVEKKGFLDADQNYLRSKLSASKARGKDRFYRDFLCPLFFEGFAQKESDRSPAVNKLLGKVPYLNGGLFLKHQIEELHGRAIDIADAAFERLFDFFDRYHWHLDERPLRQDNEINPDVLGYIFEKYINQKQMGAYYTKEDITGYISRNAVIPFLFDAAKPKCKIAFDGEQSVWRLLAANPDRYIYPAVRRGVIDAEGQVIPDASLPDFVRKGMNDPKARMFKREYNLGQAVIPGPNGANIALPTETWREYVDRRKRCLDLRAKLARGEVQDINDLITLNLDIEQFAQDVIENCEGPELLRAFWHAILQVTVLDPTCGSGAFLFAALNILESLYEACLDRMEVFLDELDRSGEKHRPEKFADFRKVLERIGQHQKARKYFIYKSIILNNLYGVDIMEEAVEICKLRLFLKLVAQIDRPDQIEPLPDIDFNIRAGNTLVGYATLNQFRKVAMRKLDGEQVVKTIEAKAQDVERLFALFRQQQTEIGGTVTAADKQALRDRLGELENELNGYLATDYAIEPTKKPAYAAWVQSHQPFHWFVEFYGIMKSGGFDVVIGNPPYVEYPKTVKEYRVLGYATEDCGNLFAFVLERSVTLSQSGGRYGLIVPMSAFSTEKMSELRGYLRRASSPLYASHWSGDAHPSTLFTGVKMRLSIVLGKRTPTAQQETHLYSTVFVRWYSECRPFVFALVSYLRIREDILFNGAFPKIGDSNGESVLRKVMAKKHVLGEYVVEVSPHSLYAHRIVAHFVKCFDFVPFFKNDRDGVKRSEDYKVFAFRDPSYQTPAGAILNSSTFYFFYLAYSDAYHCGRDLILSFPVDLENLARPLAQKLKTLNAILMEEIKANSVRRRIKYKATGWIEYDEFYTKLSKSRIDPIDDGLASHYGFTDDEVDFIVNYDIKYRLGSASGEEDIE